MFVCSTKNRVLGRVRRLRQPRYLVGAVVGAAYLYLVFLRRWFRGGRPYGVKAIPPDAFVSLQAVGGFLLWLVVVARWVVPVSRQPLQFTGAERDFLLVAPISRRRIVAFKLLRSQVGILASTALILVVAWSAVASPWSFLFGTFLLFTTLRLHLLGIAVSRASLAEGRRDPFAMVALAVALVGAVGVLAALLPGLAHVWRTADVQAAVQVVLQRTSQPAVTWALLPFAVVLRPIFAAWPSAFFVAVLPVVAIVLLNFGWVTSAEGRLEYSAGAAERDIVDGRRVAPRAAARRIPFGLSPGGRAEWAIVWKNLIMLGRYVRPAMLARVALPVLVLAFAIGASGRTGVATALFSLGLACACGLTVLGPYSFRNDLRQDLGQLSVLKTWPVSGERLLWGEVLAPSLVLTAIVWLVLLSVGGLMFALPPTSLSWANRVTVGLVALILSPAIILAQVVIQNAAVVLFPGWVAIGPARPRGVEAMGQQMLVFAGTLVLLVVGLLPGGVVGGAVALAGYLVIGWLALVPAALLVAVLLGAEAFVAIHFLGALLDRTDPSALDAASR